MPRKLTQEQIFLKSISRLVASTRKAEKTGDIKELKRHCSSLRAAAEKLEDYVIDKQLKDTALKQLPLNL